MIANTTPIAGPSGAIAGILHFELTIDSFRHAAAQFSGGGDVMIVDAATGAVIVNSRRPQQIGAKLGDPADRRFVGLAGVRGLVERGDSRLAYRTVGGGTSNHWIVVAVAPRVGGLSIVPIAAVLLALIGLALLVGSRWTRTSQQAETDTLTGLGNRRKLGADLARLLAGADESKRLTLCAYDLNGFKNYNDSFGHPAGDALLGRFGARLATAAADGNAYRLGGDEFCVVIGSAGAPVDGILAATTRGALRLRRWLGDRLLLRHRCPADRGARRRKRPAARRPATVRGQADRAPLIGPPEHRRAPAGASGA